MTMTGPKLPTAGANEGTGTAWFNTDRITTIGAPGAGGAVGSSATVLHWTTGSQYLVATGFDFSAIPDTDVIVGIEIVLNGNAFQSSPP